jgi:hypothetical protein
LAKQNDEDTLSAELENRLDDLFGEDEKFTEDPEDEDLPHDYPLSELKNLVLSIDWEITDDVLENFIGQVKQLKSNYKDDRINLTFLQILGSLGEYIKTHRGKAHPKTFKILNSVFAKFDEVVISEDLPEQDKKRILRGEMNKYKELRSQISSKKSATAAKRVERPEKKVKPMLVKHKKQKVADRARGVEKPVKKPEDDLPDAEAVPAAYPSEIARAVEDIKKYIHSELMALREDLKIDQEK